MQIYVTGIMSFLKINNLLKNFFFLILILFSFKSFSKNIDCGEFLNILNFTDPPYNDEVNGELFLRAPIDFDIYNFTDLNLKENIYTADLSFKLFYLDKRLNILNEKYNFQSGFYCEYEYEQVRNRYSVPLIYFNTTEVLKTVNDIVSFNYIDGYFYVVRLIDNVAIYRSTIPFNFKKFPFDTQSIDFRVDTSPLNYWEGNKNIDVFLNLQLEEEINDPSKWANETIFGWTIKKYKVEFDPLDESISAVMTIQRDYFYFLLKVMFPILLIVFISWSVFLIHPRAIEAKVNVTIVCLLALIAYNFVIEDNLPKVSYITIMDIFILSSYVFAALTTIFAIYSYRNFIIKEGDNIQLNSMDKFVRNFSFLIFIVTVIVLGSSVYNNYL